MIKFEVLLMRIVCLFGITLMRIVVVDYLDDCFDDCCWLLLFVCLFVCFVCLFVCFFVLGLRFFFDTALMCCDPNKKNNCKKKLQKNCKKKKSTLCLLFDLDQLIASKFQVLLVGCCSKNSKYFCLFVLFVWTFFAKKKYFDDDDWWVITFGVCWLFWLLFWVRGVDDCLYYFWVVVVCWCGITFFG